MKQRTVTAIGADPVALEHFYSEHVRAVQAFLARRLSDPEAVADVTADVFLAAIDSASGYDASRGTPRAWIFGIARHVLAEHLRRQSRELAVVGRISGRRLLDAGAIERLSEQIDAERAMRRIHGLLASIPDSDRAILELVALDGLSVSDAGSILGLTPGAARVRLHRARRRLRDLLADDHGSAYLEVLS